MLKILTSKSSVLSGGLILGLGSLSAGIASTLSRNKLVSFWTTVMGPSKIENSKISVERVIFKNDQKICEFETEDHLEKLDYEDNFCPTDWSKNIVAKSKKQWKNIELWIRGNKNKLNLSQKEDQNILKEWVAKYIGSSLEAIPTEDFLRSNCKKIENNNSNDWTEWQCWKN